MPNRDEWLGTFSGTLLAQLGGRVVQTEGDAMRFGRYVVQIRPTGADVAIVSGIAMEEPEDGGARAVDGLNFHYRIAEIDPAIAADEVIRWLRTRP